MTSDCAFPKCFDPEVAEWLVSDQFLFSKDIARREAALLMLDAIALRSPEALTDAMMDACCSDIKCHISSRSVFRDDRKDSSTEASLGYPDAEGWGSLETSVKAFNLVLACRGSIDFQSSSHIERIITQLVEHTNRFVREQGQLCIGIYIRCFRNTLNQAAVLRISSMICQGLDDNWSQVRYASLKASRSLFRLALRNELKSLTLERLVPAIMINRHFVAEGVRRYAQETWIVLVGPQGGASMLTKFLSHIFNYLIEAMDSANHSIREAVISCTCEIMTKVIPLLSIDKIDVDIVTAVLRLCSSALEDDAWPVRELGGRSCLQLYRNVLPELGGNMGSAVSAKIDYFMGLLLHDIVDPMPPLRESSSECLGFLLGLHSQRFPCSQIWSQALKIMEEKLLAYSLEKPEGVHIPGVGSCDDSCAGHEDRPMYSCGTLNTSRRARISTSDDCCIGGSCSVPAYSQPWESTDGAIRLYGAIIRSGLLTEDLTDAINKLLLPAVRCVLQLENRRKFKQIAETAHMALGDLLEDFIRRPSQQSS